MQLSLFEGKETKGLDSGRRSAQTHGMPTPRRSCSLAIFLLTVAVGLALASCSDDDSEDADTTTTTTTTTTEAPTTSSTTTTSTTTTLDPLAIGEAAPTPTPIVMYPPDVGSSFHSGTGFDLASLGYEQQEYFISGTARSFAPDLRNCAIVRTGTRNRTSRRWTLGTRVR